MEPPVDRAPLERACAQAVREAAHREGAPPSERARRAGAWARRAPDLAQALARNRREAPLQMTPGGASARSAARAAFDDILTELALAHASECMRVLRAIAGTGDAHARAAFERAARADTQAWIEARASEARWVATIAEAGRASVHRSGTTLRIPLARAGALTTVRRATWDAMAHWPPWAAALALEHASVETLGEGRDTALYDAVRTRARANGIGTPDPETVGASLATWPFARTCPPVRVIAACAQAGVDAIEGESAWGGAVRAEEAAAQGKLGQRPGEGTLARARRLRAHIEGERALVIDAMEMSAERWRDRREKLARVGGARRRATARHRCAPVLEEGGAGMIGWRVEHDREAHIEAVAGIGERSAEEIRRQGGATLVTVEAMWPSNDWAVLREAGRIEREG